MSNTPDESNLDKDAKRLREARIRLGLTQKELAERTQGAVSLATIREYEQGRKAPSRKTIMHLEPILFDEDAVSNSLRPTTLNAARMSDWDPELIENSIRSDIFEKYECQYWRHPYFHSPAGLNHFLSMSASAYQQEMITCRVKATSSIISSFVLRERVEKIDIMAFVCGWGSVETLIAEQLAQIPEIRKIRLSIFGNSIYLNCKATDAAKEHLKKYRNVSVISVLGNYQALSSYVNDYPDQPLRRIFCAIGILLNEKQDLRFLRECSFFANAGDYLVFDLLLPTADPDNHNRILDSDPRLNGAMNHVYRQLNPNVHFDDVTDLFESADQIHLLSKHIVNSKFVLDCKKENDACYAYSVIHQLNIDRGNGPIVFNNFRFNRHDEIYTGSILEKRMGWTILNKSYIGTDSSLPYPSVLMLLRKR